ncbi:MAG: hypothetical protein HKN74_12295 [Acidimicrobiia bacterium]|nr:hypothetical protein [Acidimicrobiia bacterium]MBT8215437.1 hypothetical protein [Acidimicrobiia bacterium]NNF11056.1 hypothetical protein [Acidimicrobiia bacterium]NNL68342.1 hypothetical protein [Acidimicrobiia bacterium]
MTEQRRRLIGIGGLVIGGLTIALGLTVAHFTNLPTEDAFGNEVLPSIPRGWQLYTLGQLIAVGGSQVVVGAIFFGWLWEKPLTWVRAGVGSIVAWYQLVLYFGIIPSEMLNLAQGPLEWTSRTAFTIPSWLVLNNEIAISYSTIKDALVAGYYTNAFVVLVVGIYMAQEWIKKRADQAPVVELSTYGRPLRKGSA